MTGGGSKVADPSSIANQGKSISKELSIIKIGLFYSGPFGGTFESQSNAVCGSLRGIQWN
jgi:hypothetical protein